MAGSVPVNPTLDKKYRHDATLGEHELPKKHLLHTTVTPDGYTTYEFKDPANKNSLRVDFHPSGAYRLQAADGSISEYTPSMHKIEGTSISQTSAGNFDQHIGGTMSVSTKGGAKVEITGDNHVKVGGQCLIVCESDVSIACQGNMLASVKGNINVDAGGDMSMQAKGNMSLAAGGGMSMQATTIAMQSEGDGAPGYKGSSAVG